MVEVRLHGALAAQFGQRWELDIASPAEAVQAIEAGRPGFKKAILDLAAKGMVFRVRSKTHDYNNDDVAVNLGRTRRIDIIPVVEGASAALRFVIGAVLVVAGLFFQQPWMVSVGAGMMIGSVAEWLTPKVKKEDMKDGLKSWSISGPVDTADQGMPINVIYGEVLTTGYPISAGITIAETVAGADNPSVEIGGRFDLWAAPGNGLPVTIVVALSASPVGLLEPFTYTWSYTGFATATAIRFVDSTGASMRLELDYPGSAIYLGDTGSVSVSLLGKKGNGEDGTSTVSSTETINFNISPEVSQGSES